MMDDIRRLRAFKDGSDLSLREREESQLAPFLSLKVFLILTVYQRSHQMP